jgi:hypothetical protein
LSQLKSGLTSAPRLPQTLQVKRSSISDSLASSGPSIAADCDGVAAAVVGAKDQQAAHAHFAHFSKGDFGGSFHVVAASPPSIPPVASLYVAYDFMETDAAHTGKN